MTLTVCGLPLTEDECDCPVCEAEMFLNLEREAQLEYIQSILGAGRGDAELRSELPIKREARRG